MTHEMEKMPTGIAGLDHLLEGGIVRGNSMLIEGSPGSGKSTLACRIVHEGIVQYNEPGLIITFEEFPRQVYEEALGYGVDLKAHEDAGMLRVVWTPPQRILEGFTGKNDLVDQLIEQLGVKRLVIDSITHFKRVANDEVKLREALAQILNVLKIKNVNTFMVKELDSMDIDSIAFEEYLVDASLRLYNLPSASGGENVRYIQIRKTRGQGHVSGQHPFRLGDRNFEVYPHLRASDVSRILADAQNEGDSHPAPQQVSLGVPGLDEMLGGGPMRGTMCLVDGVPGTGKSVIAMQFIEAGLRQGEACLFITLKETVSQIVRRAETLGMDWQKALDDGKLQIILRHPVGLITEEMFTGLVHELRERPPARIVFDSIDYFQHAVKDGGRVRDYLLILAQIFETLDATSMMLNTWRHMLGESGGAETNYSDMAGTVVQLTMAESDGELRRFVLVRKHLDGDHAKALREFVIDERGFQVRQKATGLSGILSGQTQGSLKQVADQVVPPLEEATQLLHEVFAALSNGKLDDEVKAKLNEARSQMGMLDITLKEYFGLSEHHKLLEELAEIESLAKH
ncbi:hypothetical protein JXA32_07115 [Candidatus Sumerlaeota bacterium]|nr:hypothetical protein [Candidatus Sumerlaeota bacterium]